VTMHPQACNSRARALLPLDVVLFLGLLLWTSSALSQSDANPPTAVIVSENFQPLKEAWQRASGRWSAANGIYTSSARGEADIATIVSYRGRRSADPLTSTLPFDRFTFRARIRNQGSESTQRAGVVYQYQDSANYYEAVLDPSNMLTLQRVSNGAVIPVKSARYSPGPDAGRWPWLDIEVVWNRGKTTVKVNGLTVVTNVAQPEYTSGQVGLITHGTVTNFDAVFVGNPFGSQPFQENFNDGVAQNWKPQSGDWSLSGGTYNNPAVQQTRMSFAPIAIGREQRVDFTFRARVLIPNGTSENLVGIVFNYRDLGGGRIEYREIVFSPTGDAWVNKVSGSAVGGIAGITGLSFRGNQWLDVTLEANSAMGVIGISVDGVGLFEIAASPFGLVGLVTHLAPGKFDDVRFDYGHFPSVSADFEFSLPPCWSTASPSGSWLVGGALIADSDSVFNLATFGCSAAQLDFVYRARLLNLYGASGNRVGLVFNYQDPASLHAGDYYEVVFTPTGTAALNKFVQGVRTTIKVAPFNVPRNTWFDVVLERSGIFTSVSVAGQGTLFQNVPQAQLGPGSIGVITHWAKGRFDDVSLVERARP
jgi:hypothetical protein